MGTGVFQPHNLHFWTKIFLQKKMFQQPGI